MKSFFFRCPGLVFGVLLACLSFSSDSAWSQDDLKDFEATLSRVAQDAAKAKANKNTQIGIDFSKCIMELDLQGKKIQRKLTARGVTAKELNIPKYVNIIRAEWNGEQDHKAHSEKSKDKDKSIDFKVGISSDEAIVELRKIINKIREMGGLSPQTGDVQVVKGETGSTSASAVKEAAPGHDKKEMFARLQELRNAIIKSDTQVGGLDPSTVKQYQETLTTRQKKQYAAIVAKYTSRGWERDKAEESAVLELHGLTKNNPDGYTEKELLTLMKKLGEME